MGHSCTISERKVVGDLLQPAHLHTVLGDILTHLGGARSEALERLLHSDGRAHAVLRARCEHRSCWSIAGPEGHGCIPADSEPLVLVAACLRVCPNGGRLTLVEAGRPTAVAARWPFDLTEAARLEQAAAGSSAPSGRRDPALAAVA